MPAIDTASYKYLKFARPKDGLLQPDDIADTYWAIHRQKRSAWTFELDIRPWLEPMTTF